MAEISPEKEHDDLKESFLRDLKTRGIPKDGTSWLVIFSENLVKKLIDFGFKLTKTNKLGFMYVIDYPKKSKSDIKKFFEEEFQNESSSHYKCLCILMKLLRKSLIL